MNIAQRFRLALETSACDTTCCSPFGTIGPAIQNLSHKAAIGFSLALTHFVRKHQK